MGQTTRKEDFEWIQERLFGCPAAEWTKTALVSKHSEAITTPAVMLPGMAAFSLDVALTRGGA